MQAVSIFNLLLTGFGHPIFHFAEDVMHLAIRPYHLSSAHSRCELEHDQGAHLLSDDMADLDEEIVWALARRLVSIRLEFVHFYLDQRYRSIPRFASLFVIAALLT